MPADGSEIPLERFAEAIDERTALVAVTAVCFRNGARLPIEEIVELAHARGALVLLDAYQAAGTYPLDVEALGVDFLAAGVLKYLLASAGLAFLWCRHDLVEELTPTQTGWFADRDIFEMDIHDYSPSPTATRFQSGTPPVPAIYAGIAGMELMEEIGIAATREHVNALNERLIAGVDELGGIVATPREAERRGALVCIRSTDPPALVRALGDDGVVVSERADNLRVSLHAYNTEDDVDAVLAALAPAPRAARDGRLQLAQRARALSVETPLRCCCGRWDTQGRRRSTRRSVSSAESAGSRALAGGQTLAQRDEGAHRLARGAGRPERRSTS